MKPPYACASLFNIFVDFYIAHWYVLIFAFLSLERLPFTPRRVWSTCPAYPSPTPPPSNRYAQHSPYNLLSIISLWFILQQSLAMKPSALKLLSPPPFPSYKLNVHVFSTFCLCCFRCGTRASRSTSNNRNSGARRVTVSIFVHMLIYYDHCEHAPLMFISISVDSQTTLTSFTTCFQNTDDSFKLNKNHLSPKHALKQAGTYFCLLLNCTCSFIVGCQARATCTIYFVVLSGLINLLSHQMHPYCASTDSSEDDENEQDRQLVDNLSFNSVDVGVVPLTGSSSHTNSGNNASSLNGIFPSAAGERENDTPKPRRSRLNSHSTPLQPGSDLQLNTLANAHSNNSGGQLNDYFNVSTDSYDQGGKSSLYWLFRVQ